ncbi:unnamed protein product [Angiostrongylus costaricensis]|uniref:Exonuclease domain-containing protein n=1 Tax=Angiostrongylus costaricensis TaxID=334426 RepID=A0A158PDK6_ANGCS|nr:unnamed protein product [Angiostrongylus costaricensis]
MTSIRGYSRPLLSSLLMNRSPQSPFATTAASSKTCVSEPHSVTQNFDNLLILDFEATCCDSGPILPYQEIIEFPVAKLDVKSWTITSCFHQYVKPTANPNITSFCTHLTGIIQVKFAGFEGLLISAQQKCGLAKNLQEMVDNQPTIDQVLNDFDEWMKKEEILKSRFAFVTCGDWDLGVMLPSEAKMKNLDIPSYFNSWINVKKSYCEHSGIFAKGLRDLLRIYKLNHSGRIHSGIDDVKTICAITSAIAKEGYVFR